MFCLNRQLSIANNSTGNLETTITTTALHLHAQQKYKSWYPGLA